MSVGQLYEDVSRLFFLYLLDDTEYQWCVVWTPNIFPF